MKRSILLKVFVVVAVVMAGTLIQATCAGSFFNVNPCGTILSTSFCDPVVYSQLYGDYWETNFDADPTCSVPYQCP